MGHDDARTFYSDREEPTSQSQTVHSLELNGAALGSHLEQ
jgi:hypothetical protein